MPKHILQNLKGRRSWRWPLKDTLKGTWHLLGRAMDGRSRWISCMAQKPWWGNFSWPTRNRCRTLDCATVTRARATCRALEQALETGRAWVSDNTKTWVYGCRWKWGGMSVHVCMSVWRSEGIRCYSSDDIHLVFWSRVSGQSDCPGSELERPALLHLPGAMIIIMLSLSLSSILCGFLGSSSGLLWLAFLPRLRQI